MDSRQEIMDYLQFRRGQIADFTAMQVDPYQQYLPTMEGHIEGGAIEVGVLNAVELRWVLDELYGYRQQSLNTVEDNDKLDARMALYKTALDAIPGETWTPPSPAQAFTSPLPPHDPTRGR